jgi:nucleoside-diphosphate-sugar epimerase
MTNRTTNRMTNIVITGGAGFLGARLARELLATRPAARLTLIDQAPVPPDLAADDRVTAIAGDLAELAERGAGGSQGGPFGEMDVVFHLASAVSGECEADFDLGLRANLLATERLLAACRSLGTNPVVVYASSLAVYGQTARHPLPAAVDDYTLPVPQTSYGTHKAIGEYLLADYTRKGFVRGRALRLVTVSVRPGRPNGAASSFMSGIIREPLAGQRAVCPVDPATEVALASPAKAVTGLLRAADASDAEWGDRTAVNLPALTVTVGEMAAALERLAGPAARALIDWVPDPVVAGIVKGWPARIAAGRAAELGLTPDPDFESIIRAHRAETA